LGDARRFGVKGWRGGGVGTRRAEQNLVVDWSERIARRVAPDEIDSAGEMAAAYARGGRARRDLFRSSASGPGAFGVTALAVVWPYVLRALHLMASELIAVLRDPALGNATAVAALGVAWRERRGDRAENEIARTAPAVPGTVSPGANRAVERLSHVQTAMERIFADNGISPPEIRVEELLAELLTDPIAAAEFLERLDGQRRSEDDGGPRTHR
jgi:hypothetical protein